MSKTIVKVWTFPSSSSDKTYETLQYNDDTTSCNCPGWTRRVAQDGSRSCKHTRMIDQGIADSESVSNHSYVPHGTPAPMQAPPVKVAPIQTPAKQKPAKLKPSVPTRKIRWQQ
jgi:hypothetical protein